MNQSFIISALISLVLLISAIVFCGRAPSDPPEAETGAIQLFARIDTMQVDSIFVQLDNVAWGWLLNGGLLTDIVAGKHQVAVSKPDPQSPIDYSSVPQMVTVRSRETTAVALALTKMAPNFTLKNLQQQEITLANYQGKVVLLVFFSHT
ncbi:MAG: peroxiredoxin family protein [candidate division KSB1 bacterium]|nr:peroxiredoxin family protein [candidate division KSB1 bacterium]MDZ7317888.1 peroxiredoxin family protein [candidate division KSB1 bacterium]MDZ7341740.1 peroxiredoxin family protein [candidate division KSB1 bacterium]